MQYKASHISNKLAHPLPEERPKEDKILPNLDEISLSETLDSLYGTIETATMVSLTSYKTSK